MLKSELNDSKILLKSIECQVDEKQAEIDQMKNKVCLCVSTHVFKVYEEEKIVYVLFFFNSCCISNF